MSLSNLSKSQYCRGKRCLKSIWLYKHRRDLAEPPSDFKTILFRQGHEVGELAQSYFPGGELIRAKHNEVEGALKQTREAIERGKTVLYEAAFLYDSILIRADIVKIHEDRAIEVIEVKSTNDVKDHHIDDVAIQKYVIENCGYKIKGCCLMHLNRNYYRSNGLDIKNLFSIVPVDSDVERRSAMIDITLKRIRRTIQEKSEPAESVGTKCTQPYDCDFKRYCWKDLSEDSIHQLTRISEDKRRLLISLGVEKIQDISTAEVKLSANQLVQKEAVDERKVVKKDKQIKTFLGELNYPLYFFDYESVSYAIPPYDNVRPYLHLPFQYSLHILNTPGGDLIHKEFIHTENTDPRRAVAEQICKDIPKDGGSVVVYHAKYERSRTEELAEAFPGLSDHLRDIVGRLWDLETPFAKRWYCDWRFGKSSSIKVVLPILCPELSYKSLAIQDGGTASVKYMEIINSKGKDRVKKELLEYCRLDTLAMAEILKFLQTSCV